MFKKNEKLFSPARFFSIFRIIIAKEKSAFEKLNCDYGENELEKHVDCHNVDNVFERIHYTIEDSLS